MHNARILLKIQITLASIYLSAAFVTPMEVTAAAGGVQRCTVGSSCTIGEFLFDDSSNPINNATCTISSRYPNDNSLYSSEPLSAPTQSDGWYAVTFTTPATLGLYRTSITCTVQGENLSIDKSFEVEAVSSSDSNAVASAVWSFSGKTLDSFGTLPSDIWSYSSRTVSSFGSLVSDVWSGATRTLTGSSLSSGNLATQSDTDAIKNKVDNISSGTTNNTTNITNTTDNSVIATINQIKNLSEQNRLLLEQVVNKPVVQNVLEETSTPIGEKLNNTKTQVNQLYINNQFIISRAASLAANWSRVSGKDALETVISISNVVGESADMSSANTMFGQSNWVSDSWNWDEASSTNLKLVSTRNLLSDLKSGLANYQKTPAQLLEVKQLVKNALALEKNIGTISDTSDQKTLFAKIGYTNELSVNLTDKNKEVNDILGIYTKSKDFTNISSNIIDLQNQVVALNKIPGVSNAITKAVLGDDNSVTNSLLSLKGIIDSNLKLLSLGANKTMTNVWLEVGSIVFKTMVTNPSALIAQKADVKYYLPKEIKKEDIIKIDDGLTVTYDSEKDQLFVTGTFSLAAGQTKTLMVETKDIWQVPLSEIQSIRDQVAELSKPLEKTAYYAQGVTLKSDINALMDQTQALLAASGSTPEDKIKSYRQAEILINSANAKLAGMKDLVTQAGAVGTLFGFVGGSQTIAVWGLVIIIAAGFMFMAIFMRTITAKVKFENDNINNNPEVPVSPKKNNRVHSTKIHPLGFMAVLIASSAMSAGITGYVVRHGDNNRNISVLGTETSSAVTATPSSVNQNEVGKGGQDIVKLVVPYGEKIILYKKPDGSDFAGYISNSTDVIKFDENDQFVKITVLASDEFNQVWVKKNFIKDGISLPDDKNLVNHNLITIQKTPTGWLKVRDSAGFSGKELKKAVPGEIYQLISEKDGWYQILLNDGNFGWVSAGYTSR